MPTSDDPFDPLEPVRAVCTADELVVTLAQGQKIVTPLWWYPRLLNASPTQRQRVELSAFGVHWPELDEDLSIEGMLAGRMAPGARQPEPA